MHEAFNITLQNRTVLENYLQNYSLEQLNKVPEGFNNNLIWNIGHIIVVQQLLVYKLSGLPTMVSDEMISKYQKGTKPEADVTREEVNEIKRLLYVTIEQAQADFDNQIFKTYHEFTNNLGFTIRSAEGAIAYNYYHEAMHLGMMMSIRKFV
ncbi:DinB family protein [Flavobacterium microcysteis]